MIDGQCGLEQQSLEMHKIDEDGKESSVGWMLYAVNRGDAMIGLTIMGAVLSIPKTAGYVFPDIVERILKDNKGGSYLRRRGGRAWSWTRLRDEACR